jgi:hypothetical protein
MFQLIAIIIFVLSLIFFFFNLNLASLGARNWQLAFQESALSIGKGIVNLPLVSKPLFFFHVFLISCLSLLIVSILVLITLDMVIDFHYGMLALFSFLVMTLSLTIWWGYYIWFNNTQTILPKVKKVAWFSESKLVMFVNNCYIFLLCRNYLKPLSVVTNMVRVFFRSCFSAEVFSLPFLSQMYIFSTFLFIISLFFAGMVMYNDNQQSSNNISTLVICQDEVVNGQEGVYKKFLTWNQELMINAYTKAKETPKILPLPNILPSMKPNLQQELWLNQSIREIPVVIVDEEVKPEVMAEVSLPVQPVIAAVNLEVVMPDLTPSTGSVIYHPADPLVLPSSKAVPLKSIYKQGLSKYGEDPSQAQLWQPGQNRYYKVQTETFPSGFDPQTLKLYHCPSKEALAVTHNNFKWLSGRQLAEWGRCYEELKHLNDLGD